MIARFDCPECDASVPIEPGGSIERTLGNKPTKRSSVVLCPQCNHLLVLGWNAAGVCGAGKVPRTWVERLPQATRDMLRSFQERAHEAAGHWG